MPSNTPETQAILPVTAEDVEAALATFDGGLVRQNDERNARGYTTFYHPKDSMRAVLEEFSARQSSSNAGGVDVGMLDRIEATIEAAERCMNASPFWDENSRHAGKALLDYPRSQIAHERAALTAATKEDSQSA